MNKREVLIEKYNEVDVDDSTVKQWVFIYDDGTIETVTMRVKQ